MNGRDASLAIMRADMATGHATKRSLGVMYAHVMAGSSCSELGFWTPINEAIIAYKGFLFLDGVKKVAWSIFEEVGRGLPSSVEPLTTSEVGAVAVPEGRSA